MLAGPTLRRRQREREASAAARRSERRWRQYVISALPPHGPSAPVESAMPRGENSVGYPSRPDLPLSMAEVLGILRGGDIAVVDGMTHEIALQPPKMGDAFVEVAGVRRGIRCADSLEARIELALHNKSSVVAQWLRRRGQVSAADLDEHFYQGDRAALPYVEQFVHGQLIPHLASMGQVYEPGQEVKVDFSTLRVARRAVSSWPPAFVFWGRRAYELVPYVGSLDEGVFYLKLGEQLYVATENRHRFRLLERLDRMLAKELDDELERVRQAKRKQSTIYDDGTYSIMRSPRGLYFLCQYVRPYAVEGRDRRYYAFAGVNVGIHLCNLQRQMLFDEGHVRVMESYEHMFVSGGAMATAICMPKTAEYYEELRGHPLAEALLIQLESARMTIASGYHQGCHPHNEIETLCKEEISLATVRQRKLPLYRYYRTEN